MFTKQQYKDNMKIFRKELSEQIINLRELNGLSLEELSIGSYVPINILIRLENGEIQHWSSIFQLAKFYEKKIRLGFY